MDPALNGAKSDFFETPHLERLADAGMRFTQGYSPATVCHATRRSIQYATSPLRQGHFHLNYPADNDYLTIPRVLKMVNPNYRTAHFGKWDLRSDLTPEHLGYDISDGNTSNREGNVGSNFDYRDTWLQHAEMDDPKRIFSITERATNFIEKQAEEGRPFFVQISHYAVHMDIQARPKSIRKYEAKNKGRIHKNAAYAAMTEDLDAGLGQILDKLSELNLSSNTYVIFMSDNGGEPWLKPWEFNALAPPLELKSPGLNHPLRGGKQVLFEGGIRVPFVVSGPGIKANSLSDTPVIGWDILPTIAELAGYTGLMPTNIDGGSFRSVLANQGVGEVDRPTEFLMFDRPFPDYPHTAIRDGDYKLIRFWPRYKLYRFWSLKYWLHRLIIPLDSGTDTFLFDLRKDPGETENLAESHPAIVQSLEKKMLDYLYSVNSPNCWPRRWQAGQGIESRR